MDGSRRRQFIKLPVMIFFAAGGNFDGFRRDRGVTSRSILLYVQEASSATLQREKRASVKPNCAVFSSFRLQQRPFP